ncbi:MAG: hypothetical protein IPL88_02340 [Rhizobiales bacterium]|nr:hypothetical protein [Hyphomicrobiales bacterium]
MTLDIERTIANLRAALKAAYDAGHAAGEAAARESLAKRVAAVLSNSTSDTRLEESYQAAQKPYFPLSDTPPSGNSVNIRGTILRTLPKFGESGATVREIAVAAGLNEYSTRGMLNRMRHEGRVTKIGNRDGKWRIVGRPLVVIDDVLGEITMTDGPQRSEQLKEGSVPRADTEPPKSGW